MTTKTNETPCDSMTKEKIQKQADKIVKTVKSLDEKRNTLAVLKAKLATYDTEVIAPIEEKYAQARDIFLGRSDVDATRSGSLTEVAGLLSQASGELVAAREGVKELTFEINKLEETVLSVTSQLSSERAQLTKLLEPIGLPEASAEARLPADVALIPQTAEEGADGPEYGASPLPQTGPAWEAYRAQQEANLDTLEANRPSREDEANMIQASVLADDPAPDSPDGALINQ